MGAFFVLTPHLLNGLGIGASSLMLITLTGAGTSDAAEPVDIRTEAPVDR